MYFLLEQGAGERNMVYINDTWEVGISVFEQFDHLFGAVVIESPAESLAWGEKAKSVPALYRLLEGRSLNR